MTWRGKIFYMNRPLEQGHGTPLDVRIARGIGSTAATLEFGLRRIGGGFIQDLMP